MMDTDFNSIHIKEYISNSYIDDEIKSILNSDIEKESNPFYFNYASLFTTVRNKQLDNINIAGYFYFRYLISTDTIFDNKQSEKNVFKNLISSNWYHEESIKILSSIFPITDDFWKNWNTRKKEYLQAFKTDKLFLNNISENEFEILADYKSANGKTAIDILWVLNLINESDYINLLQSHKSFSCGFQYYDDVIDLKQDYLNKQTNIALSALIPLVKENQVNDINLLLKLLYIKGVASNFLNKSLNKFHEALKTIELINCPLWKKVIELKIKEVKGVLQNVDFYLESLQIKTKLSNAKQNSYTNISFEIIEKSLNNAVDFISKEQEENGEWKDSPVNTWLSGYWTTGFVLNALQEIPENKLNNISKIKATEYLIKRPTKLWGYINGWVEDSDSTNFVLLGLLAQDIKVSSEITELLNYQMLDGGITTYNDKLKLLKYLNDPRIKDVQGWTQSHLCVSAGTLLLLSKVNGYDTNKEKLIDYILENISQSNLWESYWWTSSVYTTCLIIEANVNLNNKKLNALIQNSIPLLLNKITDSGFYEDSFNEKNLFYTAIILNALSNYPEEINNNKQLIIKIITAIINCQNNDGSWDSSYALRIPSANSINPNSVTHWGKSDLGENIIIEDIHRIITTSSVIKALHKISNFVD
jgi:hypothetical protein